MQSADATAKITRGGSHTRIFIIFLAVSFVTSLLLYASHVFERQELQSINMRFEARRWLRWNKESLARLPNLWSYHEAHEIPRRLWAWDYTLSWLVEPNHPPVVSKIVLFNRGPEDEPPKEAAQSFPFLAPLLSNVMPRSYVADMVRYVAKAGARAILLDIEFTQYTNDDRLLASAIKDAADGKLSHGRPVIVMFAQNPVRRSFQNVLQLDGSPPESGVVDELRKLDPNIDLSRFSAPTEVVLDEDQVVRRISLRMQGQGDSVLESMVIKVLRQMGVALPEDIPPVMYVDYAAPPNSVLYPVRPLTYLLDPDRKQMMSQSQPGNKDVTLKDAIVFIGDGLTDVYSTPVTNHGLDRMSGSEILAHAIDTIRRHSWPERLSGPSAILYLFATCLAGACVLLLLRKYEKPAGGPEIKLKSVLKGCAWLVALLALSLAAGCLLFAHFQLIVPLFIPLVSLIAGFVTAVFWEKERERVEHFKIELAEAAQRLNLEREKHQMELELNAAEAKAREAILDKQRRREFARRINHDLRAPVSVLTWTIASLKRKLADQPEVQAKIERLSHSADKLTGLVDGLVKAYDESVMEPKPEDMKGPCDLKKAIQHSVAVQQGVAEKKGSSVDMILPEETLMIAGSQTEVSRIIDNLIRNAILHNPEGTKVVVDLARENSHCIVKVEDNGRGIAPEHIELIFDAGYRARNSDHDGEGLGLNIVKTLTESSGGTIALKSELGKGTCFTLTWPLLSESKENGGNGMQTDREREANAPTEKTIPV
ncbi:MAG TPA: ATP-binding protein [Candidatus Obscuribacterales bacterium]